ncbi:MAG: ThiF family adenylyltransferase, partial [Muribaculaceae bacterium]|nr:ThiF family adenylyltransferase [Muribaculaceae bacterium]
MTHEEIFGRTALLAGDEMMARLNASRVIVFGVGGVGSWCAEALVRSGIGHITIVDSDTIAASNINRQLPALTSTVGASKVETLANRFRDINPAVDVRAIKALYNRENAPSFEISTYDYVIDAIDSLDCKAALILEATSYKNLKFFSSMGAAMKLSASKIATAEFWKVEGCPLARA